MVDSSSPIRLWTTHLHSAGARTKANSKAMAQNPLGPGAILPHQHLACQVFHVSNLTVNAAISYRNANPVSTLTSLAFYYRIFDLRFFRRLLLWVGLLCTVYMVAIDLTIIFQWYLLQKPGASYLC